MNHRLEIGGGNVNVGLAYLDEVDKRSKIAQAQQEMEDREGQFQQDYQLKVATQANQQKQAQDQMKATLEGKDQQQQNWNQEFGLKQGEAADRKAQWQGQQGIETQRNTDATTDRNLNMQQQADKANQDREARVKAQADALMGKHEGLITSKYDKMDADEDKNREAMQKTFAESGQTWGPQQEDYYAQRKQKNYSARQQELGGLYTAHAAGAFHGAAASGLNGQGGQQNGQQQGTTTPQPGGMPQGQDLASVFGGGDQGSGQPNGGGNAGGNSNGGTVQPRQPIQAEDPALKAASLFGGGDAQGKPTFPDEGGKLAQGGEQSPAPSKTTLMSPEPETGGGLPGMNEIADRKRAANEQKLKSQQDADFNTRNAGAYNDAKAQYTKIIDQIGKDIGSGPVDARTLSARNHAAQALASISKAMGAHTDYADWEKGLAAGTDPAALDAEMTLALASTGNRKAVASADKAMTDAKLDGEGRRAFVANLGLQSKDDTDYKQKVGQITDDVTAKYADTLANMDTKDPRREQLLKAASSEWSQRVKGLGPTQESILAKAPTAQRISKLDLNIDKIGDPIAQLDYIEAEQARHTKNLAPNWDKNGVLADEVTNGASPGGFRFGAVRVTPFGTGLSFPYDKPKDDTEKLWRQQNAANPEYSTSHLQAAGVNQDELIDHLTRQKEQIEAGNPAAAWARSMRGKSQEEVLAGLKGRNDALDARIAVTTDPKELENLQKEKQQYQQQEDSLPLYRGHGDSFGYSHPATYQGAGSPQGDQRDSSVLNPFSWRNVEDVPMTKAQFLAKHADQFMPQAFMQAPKWAKDLGAAIGDPQAQAQAKAAADADDQKKLALLDSLTPADKAAVLDTWKKNGNINTAALEQVTQAMTTPEGLAKAGLSYAGHAAFEAATGVAAELAPAWLLKNVAPPVLDGLAKAATWTSEAITPAETAARGLKAFPARLAGKIAGKTGEGLQWGADALRGPKAPPTPVDLTMQGDLPTPGVRQGVIEPAYEGKGIVGSDSPSLGKNAPVIEDAKVGRTGGGKGGAAFDSVTRAPDVQAVKAAKAEAAVSAQKAEDAYVEAVLKNAKNDVDGRPMAPGLRDALEKQLRTQYQAKAAAEAGAGSLEQPKKILSPEDAEAMGQGYGKKPGGFDENGVAKIQKQVGRVRMQPPEPIPGASQIGAEPSSLQQPFIGPKYGMSDSELVQRAAARAPQPSTVTGQLYSESVPQTLPPGAQGLLPQPKSLPGALDATPSAIERLSGRGAPPRIREMIEKQKALNDPQGIFSGEADPRARMPDGYKGETMEVPGAGINSKAGTVVSPAQKTATQQIAAGQMPKGAINAEELRAAAQDAVTPEGSKVQWSPADVNKRAGVDMNKPDSFNWNYDAKRQAGDSKVWQDLNRAGKAAATTGPAEVLGTPTQASALELMSAKDGLMQKIPAHLEADVSHYPGEVMKINQGAFEPAIEGKVIGYSYGNGLKSSEAGTFGYVIKTAGGDMHYVPIRKTATGIMSAKMDQDMAAKMAQSGTAAARAGKIAGMMGRTK